MSTHRRIGLAIALAVAGFGRSEPCWAHDPFEVTTLARVVDRELTLRVTMPTDTEQELAKRSAGRNPLYDVALDGERLSPLPARKETRKPSEVTFVQAYRLPLPDENEASDEESVLGFRATHVEALADGYTSVLRVTLGASPSAHGTPNATNQTTQLAMKVLHPGDVTLEISVPRSTLVGVRDAKPGIGPPATSFGDYFALGIEHMLTGYDHLAFLLGLLLGTASLKRLLLAVTGFTLAHSLTLAASLLGWVTLPGAAVEILIAASIVYVGVENLRLGDQTGWQRERVRVLLAFVFGLIHGMGFASVLRTLGLAEGKHLMLALFGFNLGLEVAQLCVAALFLLAFSRLRSRPWRSEVRRGASLGVALLGAFWLCARVFEVWSASTE